MARSPAALTVNHSRGRLGFTIHAGTALGAMPRLAPRDTPGSRPVKRGLGSSRGNPAVYEHPAVLNLRQGLSNAIFNTSRGQPPDNDRADTLRQLVSGYRPYPTTAILARKLEDVGTRDRIVSRKVL